MLDIPIAIEDCEVIARAIFYPRYVNNSGKLKGAAFRSPGGVDEVSVFRHTYMGSDECKDRARKMEKKPDRTYRGLAALLAREIRMHGSDVVDSREIFLGHADIKHGFLPIAGEPLPPEMAARLDDLAKTARFYRDPSPDTSGWSGEEIK